MIHFDFTVSDTDAENIINILRKQITRNTIQIRKMISQGETDLLIDAYRRDNEYVEGLIKKMTNTRVE